MEEANSKSIHWFQWSPSVFVSFIELEITAVIMTEIPDGIYKLQKIIIILYFGNLAYVHENLNKWAPSFLKHFNSIKHRRIRMSASAHTHLLSSRAWTIAHRREGCEERCGILLGLIYQRQGEVLSGHSSAVDSGPGLGPLGDRQTLLRSWCSGKKSTTHKHTFTRTLFCFHTLVFLLVIKERRVPVKDMPPPGASCSSCRRVYVSFVFLAFSFFLSFLFWHLSPCSLCMSMLCPPSMTRASHSARWTSHLVNLHSLHKSWSCHSFEKQMVFSPLTTLHKHILVMLWIFRISAFPVQVIRDIIKLL